MIERIFPHPVLAGLLTIVWIMLMNQLTPGTLVMGAIVGIAVTKLTSVYWPERPRIRRPLLIAEYVVLFLRDILISNLQVAWLVLFRDPRTLNSRFITVPLEASTPEAVVALAATITLTPGTLSVDVADDRRSLVVHCIDVDDVDVAIADIKQRYERRLIRILT